MAKKKKKSRSSVPKESGSRSIGFSIDNWDVLISSGYTPLSQNPEIISAVNKTANLIAGMTIHLMENTENGDQRLINELSRKIDINPNPYMTRATFISALVRILLLEGDGNAVIYPETRNGLIDGLYILPPGQVSFILDGFGYYMMYNGVKYTCDELVHIPINPDPVFPWKGTGYRKTLRQVADTLKQASATKKGFMESKWKPSIIVKADGMTEEFSTKEGRTKLLNKYIESSDAGQPWIIPADQFDVVTVKPLSLNDLAIKDSVELDKKTVAGILDIPAFVLGIGSFNEKEWNNWINTRIKNICNVIEQALTKVILISPNLYFRFNHRSLFAYDIETLSNVGCNLFSRGILSRNEVRDSIGYSPREGLDELIILENYIPSGMIGDQKKLNGGGEQNE